MGWSVCSKAFRLNTTSIEWIEITVSCIFCEQDAVLENDLAYCRVDRFPVSPGHLLIIPKRHAEDWFDLSNAEKVAINDLLEQGKQWIEKTHRPDGYNIGMNCGAAAGQTVFHMHCHLIPRYDGDTKEPKGGVRGVIPEKMQYE
ncbi:histidine triad protein [gamma proteobacterium HTCC5015]|nr:histidine triad protein [gamma proteobacterium HTCC5015]